MKYSIATIPGDGIGTEVMAAAVKVLEALAEKTGLEFEFRLLYAGDEHKERTGVALPPETIEGVKASDACLFAAVGNTAKEVIIPLRQRLNLYANLRPAKAYPGVPAVNPDVDIMIVRENTEGIYTGMGGVQYKGMPSEVSTQINCTTRFGAERAIRYAFEVCRRRNSPKKMLTLVHKTNVLTYAGGTWYRAFMEIGREYPDIKKDYNHVDACCMWFVKNPEYYDVIVTDNLFGDIITDLAAIVQGGLGVAAGGNINPKGVSMFEPMGGSAPKYTGKNVINPIAAIASLGMLLRETGNNKGDARLVEAGNRVESAVMATTPKMQTQAAGKMGFSTTQIGDMVAAAVAGSR